MKFDARLTGSPNTTAGGGAGDRRLVKALAVSNGKARRAVILLAARSKAHTITRLFPVAPWKTSGAAPSSSLARLFKST